MKRTQALLASSALASALFIAGCKNAPPKPAFVPPPPAGILTAAEVDQPPRLIGRPLDPQYPPDLLRAGVSGRATVRFIVTHDGRVIDVTVMEATHPSFGTAAAAAVSKWKYAPAIKYGQPIACLVTVPVGFSLGETHR